MRIGTAVAVICLLGGRAAADVSSEIALANDAAARGLPLAALFHAARANQLGGEVSVAHVDVDALWIELPTRPRVTVPESCEWLRDSIAYAYPESAANLDVHADLTCAYDERTWTENQDYTWYEEVERIEQRTVPGQTITNHATCSRQSAEVCQTYSNGQRFCSSHPETYDCSTTSTGPSTTENVTVTDQIPHPGNHDVSRHALSISVLGSVSSKVGRAKVDYAREVDEIEFSDEHGSQSFSYSRSSLEDEAMGALAAAINELVAPVRKAQIAVELTAAGSAGDKLIAEEHRLRAWTLGDPASALARAYGLTEPQLAELLMSGGLEVPWELQVLLYKQEQETREQEAARGPRRPSILSRVFATPRLTLGRTTRLDGGLTSTGYGARIELGWRLRKTLDYALGVAVGGGTDDQHGGEFDARAGVAVGLSSRKYQLAYLIGVGVAGTGVRAAGEAMSTLDTQGGAFHGVDFRLRSKPFGLDGRLVQLRGGPLGDGMRASAQVLFEHRGVVIGVEGSIQQYDGDGDAKITGVGLTIGLDREQPSSGSAGR